MVLPCLTPCIPNDSKAQVQVTVSQGNCSDGNTPCTTIASPQGANAPHLDLEGIPPFGPGQVAIVSAGGAIVGLQDEAAVVKNEPYQAQAVTEMKQTLADGSHIVQTTTATVARDSDGRTVRIQKLSTIGPWRSADFSQGSSQTLTTIFDPVTKEHIDYTSDSKVAHVLAMPPLPPGAVVGGEASVSVGSASSCQPRQGPWHKGLLYRLGGSRLKWPRAWSQKQSLLVRRPSRAFRLLAHALRAQFPLALSAMTRLSVITRETWYSPELQFVVQSTQNDPRFGQTTYTLTNIQRGEPDVTLFQIPADYKIDKVVPRTVKAPTQ